jgi:CRISPR-associated endonuclease/helicase Cas3
MKPSMVHQKPQLVAHTPREGTDEWHDLYKHLECVTKMTKIFAKDFAEVQAAVVGWLHDFGKISPKFQAYLHACARGEAAQSDPHAIWGAAFLFALSQKVPGLKWHEFALLILGHHAGLKAATAIENELREFLEDTSRMPLMLEYAKEIGFKANFQLPVFKTEHRREFWVRMLFSCLVDADFLDTEDHFQPHRKLERQAMSIDQLIADFPAGRERFLEQQRLEGKIPSAKVQRVRDEVFKACLERALGQPGFYRLTVPTGGGKTLSSLAFALRHARVHGLCRVIIGIPYTSIIDQTASVLRDVLGEDAILEHHSAIQPIDDPNESQKEHLLRQRLLAENWDHPLIVTTTVQLFESLFARRTSQCRKLHNLVRSVIVLDEVQTLPPELLEPTLDALRTLVEDYSVTVVLCTATQPAFENTRSLQAFQGLTITELVPQYVEHFAALQRVTYERRNKKLSWQDLWQELQLEETNQKALCRTLQVMIVLNTRKDALALLQEVSGEGVYHLSTLLCGAHRKIKLEEMKQRLKEGKRVILCATQVVEAGVDISFPLVYRAMGPLERIIQAAGRCNRNDELAQPGRVVIFEPLEFRSPRGAYLVGFEKALEVLHDKDPNELHHPDIAQDYFNRVYDRIARTKDGKRGRRIQEARAALDFPTVAAEYRLIDNDTVSIVVPYAFEVTNPTTKKNRRVSSETAFQRWLHMPSRKHWQAVQQFIVNVFQHDLKAFTHDLEPVLKDSEPIPGLFKWRGTIGYDDTRGLIGFTADPADLSH